MSEFSAADGAWMARALQLAARGRYTARPNPMVGCVLVRDGKVLGEGWHRRTGELHAEAIALQNAGDAKGASAYVTLEPCAHRGRTPPCADALFLNGVSEVVCALEDPFEKVSGRGINALSNAGVRVRTGLMEVAARELNRGYLTRVQKGRPFVRMKIATSLDGAVAMESGESHWITGADARADVQRLRAESGAILSGIGTVMADDPSFTVRDPLIENDGVQPVRVVLDSSLRLPLSSGMLCLPGDTLVFCADDNNRKALEAAGAEVVKVAEQGGHVDLNAVLDELGRREINDLLVEAGPGLSGAVLSENLADELVIYQAPHIMGSETIPMFRTPGWTELADRREIEITDTRRIGTDTRITARIRDEAYVHGHH